MGGGGLACGKNRLSCSFTAPLTTPPKRWHAAIQGCTDATETILPPIAFSGQYCQMWPKCKRSCCSWNAAYTYSPDKKKEKYCRLNACQPLQYCTLKSNSTTCVNDPLPSDWSLSWERIPVRTRVRGHMESDRCCLVNCTLSKLSGEVKQTCNCQTEGKLTLTA